MIRIRKAEHQAGFIVKLTFSNGETRDIDLEPYLNGPVFEAIRRDSNAFRSLAVDPELGTLVWPNGADIDPDVLFHGRTPAAWSTGAGSRG